MIVESLCGLMPGPPVGASVTTSGGHDSGQPLIVTQLSVFLRSLVNSYSVNPAELLRIRPWLVWRSSTVAAPAAGLAAANAPTLATAASDPAMTVRACLMKPPPGSGVAARAGARIDGSRDPHPRDSA